MIRIQDLRFSYSTGSFDLSIPQLQIASSAATAVAGPSGSGKTTLLHLIAGILTPAAGTISVNGTNVPALPDQARRQFRITEVGLIFQEFELIDYLSVLDNVLLPCRITRTLPLTQQARQRALQLLTQAGLGDYAGRSVTQLSHGERQRVAICRALLPQPKLLLADEPTGNLDPATSQQILKLLLTTVAEAETTLVMVTHNHAILDQFDRTIDFSQFLMPSTAATTPGESG